MPATEKDEHKNNMTSSSSPHATASSFANRTTDASELGRNDNDVSTGLNDVARLAGDGDLERCGDSLERNDLGLSTEAGKADGQPLEAKESKPINLLNLMSRHPRRYSGSFSFELYKENSKWFVAI